LDRKVVNMSRGPGWHDEPARHALAARGIKSATFPGAIPHYEMNLIAGRGSLGSLSWGYADPSHNTIHRWKKNLDGLIGERVALSGGGGYEISTAMLEGVWIEDRGRGKLGLKVRLTDIDPDIVMPERPMDDRTFEPFIGSWQISKLNRTGYISSEEAEEEEYILF